MSVSPSSQSPTGATECIHAHLADFPENSVQVVSLDVSLGSSAFSTSSGTEMSGHLETNPLVPRSKALREKESLESTITDDSRLEAASVKSKRASSASNDVSYERDRFRARFKTFNTNSPVVSEEEDAANCSNDSCVVQRFPSQKTKKLNCKDFCPTESILDVLSNYSIKEPISPLSKTSSFFLKHILPFDPKEEMEPFLLFKISVGQLASVFNWYFNNPLPPTNRMFPWLHGLNEENYAQKSFFASQNLLQRVRSDSYTSIVDLDLEIEKPQDVRFIMSIETLCNNSVSSKAVRNTVKTEEILCRIQYSRQEVCLRVKSLMSRIIPQDSHSQEKWAGLTEAITADSFKTGFMPEFTDLDPKRGVSLRNFHIQSNKIARCSDFIVYCFTDKHSKNKCNCSAFGRLLRVAQIIENKHLSPDYNVFILSCEDLIASGLQGNNNLDTETLEILTVRDSSSSLVGLDPMKKTQLLLYSMILLKADTYKAWDADYFVKEKVETTRMSAASRLYLNVWSGNIWDYQLMMQILKESTLDTSIQHRFEIKFQSDGRFEYCDPQNSSLMNDKSYATGPTLVSMLPSPKAHWQLFVLCHNDARFPDESQIQDLLFKYTITSHKAVDVTEFHQFEFPSSGSIGLGDCKQTSLISFVNLCKLMYLYSSCVAEDGLSTLIYCSDGYTELSLLVLSYLMYAEDVPLDEAILNLHLRYGRPFYIFNNDVSVLRKVEPLLRKFSPKRLGADIVWSKTETITNLEFNDILLGKSNLTPQTARPIPRRLRLGYVANDSDSSSDSEDESNCSSLFAASDRDWVEELEGLFPSRILPYLYLGSLKHANNTTILTKLGITKVISVGETVDWIQGYKFRACQNVRVDVIDGGGIELFTIEPKNNQETTTTGSFAATNQQLQAKLHELKPVVTRGPSQYLGLTVEHIMKINNLQDDGIDELSRPLPRILDFISSEYAKSGGKAKILVHCRVGVSRSASVVIAEVMRRYGLNLPQAYLFVRVRRLNIVIQPNLRFMYELFKWEERERMKRRLGDSESLRVIDWFVMCDEIKKLNMPFVSN